MTNNNSNNNKILKAIYSNKTIIIKNFKMTNNPILNNKRKMKLFPVIVMKMTIFLRKILLIIKIIIKIKIMNRNCNRINNNSKKYR